MKFAVQRHRLTKKLRLITGRENVSFSPQHKAILIKAGLQQILSPNTSCPPFNKKVQGALKGKEANTVAEVEQASEQSQNMGIGIISPDIKQNKEKAVTNMLRVLVEKLNNMQK